MDDECALYFHHKLIGNKIGGGKIISLTTVTFVSLTFICVWSRLSHQCPWGLTLRSTPDPRGNDLISVQHKETQMTAFSMPCFCATEGINYKNAFNRSAKSGVLHCLGRSPILRRSRSIPPSLLPAVISSSSEIPLLFGIGFTWLIQTVNRLPLQKQKKTEEYTVKLPGWIRGLWATAHCQNVIKPQWEKMSSLRGAREGENNGVRREGGVRQRCEVIGSVYSILRVLVPHRLPWPSLLTAVKCNPFLWAGGRGWQMLTQFSSEVFHLCFHGCECRFIKFHFRERTFVDSMF